MTVEIKSPTTLREVCNWILDNGVNWSACARELRIDRSTIWRWVEASKADPTDPQWRFEYAGEMMSFADAILAAARLHETKSEWDNAAAARGVVSRGPGELRPRPLHLAATPPAERELSDHEAKVAAEMDAMLADDPPETVEIAETAPVVAPAPEIEPVKPARAARGDPLAIQDGDSPAIIALKRAAAIPPRNPRPTLPTQTRAYPAGHRDDPVEHIGDGHTPADTRVERAISNPGADRIGPGKIIPGGFKVA